MIDPAPLILTALFAPEAAAELQALRQRYFPPERNIVPAHLTLFHKLPGAKIAAICRDLGAACAGAAPMDADASRLRFLGYGVAIEMACEPLVALRAGLARGWAADLSAQDGQAFRPHVTIQNKVSSAQARALYDELGALWAPRRFPIEGLQLWHYEGGPWRAAAVVRFDS